LIFEISDVSVHANDAARRCVAFGFMSRLKNILASAAGDAAALTELEPFPRAWCEPFAETGTAPRVKTQLTMLRFNGLATESGGQQMRANLFWFSDGQWARIEPFIPSNRRGVKPKNNRRILSGIMHVLKSGCRWVDCPPEYGPAKTVYNRFNRWSAQGIWQSIFEAAAEPAEPPERMALDSTHVKAHRCAGGGKGGRRNRRLASPRAGATARFTALSISCAARGS
jgi:transposase